jgi:hypothetical protein
MGRRSPRSPVSISWRAGARLISRRRNGIPANVRDRLNRGGDVYWTIPSVFLALYEDSVICIYTL